MRVALHAGVARAAGGRHRPRRRVRPARGHDGAARAGGEGARQGPRHQQVSRRRVAAHVRDSHSWRSGPARRSRASSRISRTSMFPRRTPWASPRRATRTMPNSLWISRSSGCPTSPTSTTSIRCATSRASACATSGGPRSFGAPDLVVLPGSKTTVADLDWLRATGLAERVVALRRGGTPVVGICAGYQMLGAALFDPDSVESPRPATPGLGLLRGSTTFLPHKSTHQVRGRVADARGLLGGCDDAEITAYEIHVGVTSGAGHPRPFVVESRSGRDVDEPDGALGRRWTHAGHLPARAVPQPRRPQVGPWSSRRAARGVDPPGLGGGRRPECRVRQAGGAGARASRHGAGVPRDGVGVVRGRDASARACRRAG